MRNCQQISDYFFLNLLFCFNSGNFFFLFLKGECNGERNQRETQKEKNRMQSRRTKLVPLLALVHLCWRRSSSRFLSFISFLFLSLWSHFFLLTMPPVRRLIDWLISDWSREPHYKEKEKILQLPEDKHPSKRYDDAHTIVCCPGSMTRA